MVSTPTATKFAPHCKHFCAIVGSTAAVWLGAVQWFPESAIWAWPLVTNLGVYMAGILLGAVITALMVVFLRHLMYRKGKLLIESL